MKISGEFKVHYLFKELIIFSFLILYKCEKTFLAPKT